MDKQPVGQLPDISQSSLDDEIMIITEADTSQLRKEKISNILTDIISVQENNALTKGTDGKMFVTDFGNASNITEGTLPTSVLPDIPKDKLPDIEITDLPESGVTADTYAYPSSVTVNAQGQVTAIEEGTPSGANADRDLSNLTPAGEKHFLNKTQLTNCILSAPNGVATYSGSTITVKQGLKVLIPNGRNADGTLNNIVYTLEEDVTVITGNILNEPRYLFLLSNGTSASNSIYDFYISSEQPTVSNTRTTLWYNPETNLYQLRASSTSTFNTVYYCLIAQYGWNGSTVTSLTPYQPVELIKRTDPQIQAPYITETYVNGTSWYRVWSNGFIEQGANVAVSDIGSLSFPRKFTTTNYTIVSADEGRNAAGNLGILTRTVSGVDYDNSNQGAHILNYYVCGY